MKDQRHRPYTPPGGHKPYRNTPKGQSAPARDDAQPSPDAMRHQAEHFLRQKVGGQWKWEAEFHEFASYFEPRIATAIGQYLDTQSIKSLLPKDMSGERVRVALDSKNAALALQCSALKNEPKPLTRQYEDALAMSRK